MAARHPCALRLAKKAQAWSPTDHTGPRHRLTLIVAGDAAINVNLASMTSRADFTNLETWGANVAPGAVGTGETWIDDDLGNNILVRGNTLPGHWRRRVFDGYIRRALA